MICIRRAGAAAFGLLCGWGLVSAEPGRAGDSIALMYNERPPYMETGEDGVVAGLTATPAISAFEAAGIAYHLVAVPTNRQLATVRAGVRPACAIGWFRRAERLAFARFTKPLYRDRPTVILTQNRNRAVRAHETVRALMGDRDLRLLVKVNFSYGAFIDALRLFLRPPTVETIRENTGMILMIEAERADYMFMAREEADHLLTRFDPDAAQRLTALEPADMPFGDTRHLMCTKSVAETTIEKLNAAIPDLPES